MITVSFIARGVTWGRIQHSREEETDPRVPWVGVWRWSTYDMSADFSSFFHVSESIRSPVTMSIFICRLCLTPVGELISWIPEAEGSFSLLAPMRLLRNFFMKLMLNALYCLQSLYQKTSQNQHSQWIIQQMNHEILLYIISLVLKISKITSCFLKTNTTTPHSEISNKVAGSLS